MDKEAGNAVQALSSPHLKFSLNAAQGTLPHNANLALWRKNDQVSDACRLCHQRQTLAHILNCCPVALNCRRYNKRCDAVLTTIVKFLEDHIDDDYQIVADLGAPSGYLFPLEVVATDFRPDIVLFNAQRSVVVIIELTVCYELSFQGARQRKEAKYLDLVEDVERCGYDAELILVQVGSRGFVDIDSFQPLQNYVGASKRRWRQMFTDVPTAAIKGSFKIWAARNHPPE